MIAKRPFISIITFNESDISATTLIESINKLSDDLKSKSELIYVVFNKQLSDENKKLVLSVKRYMPVKFVDYSEKYGRDLTAYCRGYHPIEKSIYDRITNTELENLINKETNK